MHTLVRTSKPRCNHTITLYWVRQTFLDIRITLSTTTNSASTVSTVAAYLFLKPAEALSATDGPRSATAIMRQQTQARHFATWYRYSYRTRTSRVRATSAGRGLHIVRAGKKPSSAPGFQFPNVIVKIGYSEYVPYSLRDVGGYSYSPWMSVRYYIISLFRTVRVSVGDGVSYSSYQ